MRGGGPGSGRGNIQLMAWRSGGTLLGLMNLLYNQFKNTQITPIIHCTIVKVEVEAQFGGMERKKMEMGERTRTQDRSVIRI
jgi:hypothetical protein